MIVFITGYGIRPTSTTSWRAPPLKGSQVALGRRLWLPVWQTIMAASGMPELLGARRVKTSAVTPEGARVRKRLVERMSEPPPAIAALPDGDARALRDILHRAVESAAEAANGDRKGQTPARSAEST